MEVSMAVIMDCNNAIGNGHPKGYFPCFIKNHLKRLKKICTRKIKITGRKSFEKRNVWEAPGYDLIISKSGYHNKKGSTFLDLKNCLHVCELLDMDIIFLGGESIFTQGIEYCDKLYVTQVPLAIENPTCFFPKIDPNEWKLVKEQKGVKDLNNRSDYVFLDYERIV